MELDEVDEKILSILKEKGRISYTELGDKIDVSDVAAKKRINKLEDKGIIDRFTVKINYSKIGKPLHAFLLLKLAPGAMEEVEEKLGKNERALKFHRTIGEYDLVVETACGDLEKLKELSERYIGNIKRVQEIRTAIVTE